MNDRDLMQEALDALESLQAWPETPENFKRFRAIEALRTALAQPEPEPVVWKMKGVPAFATSRPNDTDSIKWDALYTAPPQREWQGLTDEEIIRLRHLYDPTAHWSLDMFARVIEAKLKEKNK